MPKQYTLAKEERLKSRKRIDQLFKEGQSFSLPPFRVYDMVVPPATAEKDKNIALQFGVGVSSKHFKKAVDRNRIKRLAREAWRLQKNELITLLHQQQRLLIVFVIYTGRTIPDFVLVKEKMNAIILRLVKKISQPPVQVK
jgi:ribonuclease P protein component